MNILAIETSCDETSVAVATSSKDGISVASNVVSSQVKIHSAWGGVVPNLAAREHLKNIIPVIDKALDDSGLKLRQIDLFAVTQGPGLIPALLIGTNSAKALSYANNKPLLGIHHVEGHIYANLLDHQGKREKLFPLLALVVSGGHTQLVLMRKHFEYEIIGETQDDAAGEAFDKIAKMLELGYPGGPQVAAKAAEFEKTMAALNDQKLKEKLRLIEFPRPMLDKPNFDFSFSGLKTAVLYFIKDLEQKKITTRQRELYLQAICHAFQEAAIDVLAAKTFRAVKKHHPLTLLVAGGVAANKQLVGKLKRRAAKFGELQFIHPKLEYCGDNAAMIAIAADYRYKFLQRSGKLEDLDLGWAKLEAKASLKLSDIK